MNLRTNDWSLMPADGWIIMVVALVAGLVIALLVEWMGRARPNKWSDWKRRR